MTMVTITVNERTKAGKALLATARIMAKNSTGIEFAGDIKGHLEALPKKKMLSKAEKELVKGLKEAKEIMEGKRTGKPIEQLLDEA